MHMPILPNGSYANEMKSNVDYIICGEGKKQTLCRIVIEDFQSSDRRKKNHIKCTNAIILYL